MAHLTLRGQELRKFQFPPGITVNDCQTQVIIFKLKPDIDLAEDLESDNDLLEIHQVDQVIEMTDCQPLFPNAQYQPHQTRLANIYKVQLPPGTDLLKSINKLLQYSNVEYAEPLYKISPLYVPDDPEADPDTGSQVHLSIVRAYDAWDIQKGDTSQIIAILDTGVKLDHEDLTDNLAYNYDDPINGLDDDNDGFIDNFMGWDIADDDNDPTADFDGHGSEVTGVSSASTDNGLGVAGVGFNAKFLPIKIFRSSDNGFMNGYEAITMAAEQGASVINLSWGGPDAYQQFAQDIIDFAVLDMDAVVVAAAGNTDAELTFYPASYNNVLSVGATENDDTKAGFATYSRHIDLMAPGTTNYTTKNDGSYGNANGSSFSAPLVAGAAALVRAQFPDLTAQQVMEQIRVTADDIYQIPFNLPYDEKLGKGRLNMHEALTNNSVPSIRITDLSYQNSFGEFIFYDDTVTITTELINFLNPTQSLKVTLSSSSSSITLIDSIYQPGVVNTLESIENQGSEFKVRVENDLLPGDTLEFRLGFEDDEYQDFQYFNLITSPEYLTVENGDFEMTAGKNGYLGYNMNGFQQGIGLEFEGNKLVDHLGLILTVHPDSVSNNVVNDFMAMERDESFITTKNIRYFNNSTASEDLRSQFNDSNEGDFSMGLIVEEKLLGFQGPNNKSFLIIEYRVINNGSKDLQDLYVGFYSDWNLEDQLSNRADWDGNLNLGYVFDGTSTSYAGIALLTSQDPAYYAIDNLTLNGNTQDISNDFTKTDKYNFISGGIAKLQAGQIGSGNDVSHLVGGAIDELLLNQSTKIAFVLVAGHTLDDLQAAVSQAQSKYAEYLENPPVLSFQQFCLNLPSTITLTQGTNFEFYSDIELINQLHTGNDFTTGPLTGDTIFYVINIDQTYDGDIHSVKLYPNFPEPDFSLSLDTLFLDDNPSNTIQFTDLSQDAVQWEWSFNHGFGSIAQNPTIPFEEPGEFTAQLKIVSSMGCLDSISKMITVIEREPGPVLEAQIICSGTKATIKEDGNQNIMVYADPERTQLLFSGAEFQTGKLTTDTIFYVTNQPGLIESKPTPVIVTISTPEVNFSVQPDTTNLEEKFEMLLINLNENAVTNEWQVNDQMISDESQAIFNYEGFKDIKVFLLVSDTLGCENSTSQLINLAKSDLPKADPVFSCKNQPVIIKPSNGFYFLFYDQSDLEIPIYKGSTLNLGHLKMDQEIFITSIDQFLESDPISVNITIDSLEALFEIEPKLLNLSDANQVPLTNQSLASDLWDWIIDGIHYGALPDTSWTFERPGHHEIGLLVSNQRCVDTLFQDLEVVKTLGFEIVAKENIVLYPNPSEGYIWIKSKQFEGNAIQVRLMDLHGRLIWKQIISNQSQPMGFDLSDTQPGMYILVIQAKNILWQSKILLTR